MTATDEAGGPGARGVRRRVTIAVALLALIGAAVVGLVLVRPDADDRPRTAVEPTPTATTAASTPTAEAAAACSPPAERPFRPRRITVEGVVRDAPIVPLARDAGDVPGVLPEGEKHAFAWDEQGIRPGSSRGNVLLNVHTWPDGSATGNAMLRDLDDGERIILRGGGHELCYEVTERIEVAAADGYPPYYDTDGPPQVAIVVCSGERSEAGEWSHRTLWFARPAS